MSAVVDRKYQPLISTVSRLQTTVRKTKYFCHRQILIFKKFIDKSNFF